MYDNSRYFQLCSAKYDAKIHHLRKKSSMNFFVVLQFDTFESQNIMILSNPRGEFRPRTQNECKFTSHYLRCEPNSSYEYPTISVCINEIQLANKRNVNPLISDSSTMGTTINEKHHRDHSLCRRWKTT